MLAGCTIIIAPTLLEDGTIPAKALQFQSSETNTIMENVPAIKSWMLADARVHNWAVLATTEYYISTHRWVSLGSPHTVMTLYLSCMVLEMLTLALDHSCMHHTQKCSQLATASKTAETRLAHQRRLIAKGPRVSPRPHLGVLCKRLLRQIPHQCRHCAFEVWLMQMWFSIHGRSLEARNGLGGKQENFYTRLQAAGVFKAQLWPANPASRWNLSLMDWSLLLVLPWGCLP